MKPETTYSSTPVVSWYKC